MTDITELAQRLKAAAEKATQGNWRAFQYHDGRCGIGGGHNAEIMVCEHISKERPHDAMFIALASPANVLALVEALEKAQQRIVRELAAAPHDTPALNSVQSVVTVPGKWIPVSERMPDVGVKVLCFPVEDEPIHAVFNGQLWLQDVSWSGSYEPIDNVIPVTVTHWMPLPAGPQGVKGE